MSLILFIFSIIVFSFLFWKEKDILFIFRSLGLVFSILVVFIFNFNWIFKFPISLNLATFIFVVLSVFYWLYKKRYKEKIFDLRKIFHWNNYVIILFFLVSFSICYLYFEKNFNEPRYISPDSGGHYLYMSETAKKGFLPLFLPSKIYPASGNNEVFLHHHDTHFPGASAIFFFLAKIFPDNQVSLIQFFNMALYSLVASYFALLIIKRNLIVPWIIPIFLAVIFLGTFFDMFSASYTSQLFGLFLLLFFIDSFWNFQKEKINIIVPVFSLSALIISYPFWIPISLFFSFFSGWPVIVGFVKSGFKTKKEILQRLIFPLVLSFILSFGYILVALKAGILGYANEGSPPFSNYFYPNIIFILPFSIFSLVFLLVDFKKKKENWLFCFSASAIIYSIFLYAGSLVGSVSEYALVKSYFLTIPIFWVLGLSFFKLRIVKKISLNLSQLSFLKKNHYFIIAKMFVLALFFFSIWQEVDSQELKPSRREGVAPFISKNASLIAKKDKYASISEQQLEFMNKLKKDYSWAIKENRILILAPPDTSLWIFAYADIWPRTLSLISKGAENKGIFSPMSFYSRDILDYGFWLRNDSDHLIVFFDNPFSRKWAKENDFNLNDYEIIFSAGNNYLLRLKKGKEVRYVYKNDGYQDFLNDDLKKENARTPLEKKFIPKDKILKGISLQAVVKRKQIKGDYFFEINRGECNQKEESIIKSRVGKNNLQEAKDEEYIEIIFDNPIQFDKNISYCLSFYPESEEKPDTVVLKINSQTGNLIMKENYTYIIKE